MIVVQVVHVVDDDEVLDAVVLAAAVAERRPIGAQAKSVNGAAIIINLSFTKSMLSARGRRFRFEGGRTLHLHRQVTQRSG
jgi:hypothetical protein